MKLYTIGFTQKSAERFFSLLRENGIERVVDIRLHPGGQLAGFAKQDDLRFFLARLADCDYHHLPLLAPSEELFSDYRRNRDWERYTQRFEALMDERQVPDVLERRLFEERVACLLCSEASPERCHRRLVTERLARHWPGVEVIHLE
jgi:uncharacterized protein (DUF488 family)